jgi:hypothetical protein
MYFEIRSLVVVFCRRSRRAPPHGETVTQTVVGLHQAGIIGLAVKEVAQAVNKFFDRRLAVLLSGVFLERGLDHID